MDFIDILLARAMTPQGQINTYAARAEKAVQDANQVLNSITEIKENLNDINNLEEFTDAEIDKLVVSLINNVESDAITLNLVIQYPNDDTEQLIGTCTKYYTTTGQNTDGTMTQKAITDAINAAAYNSGGSSTPVTNNKILGLKINYTTSTMTPIDDAENNVIANFNSYTMYGGRKKCLVDNEGNIIAFYGEENYNEMPTNGYQIMIYQPKFYYKRTILSSLPTNDGILIKEEKIQISPNYLLGFKLHPLFIDLNNNELDYVLLSAYEGSIESGDNNNYKDITYNNFLNKKLSSIAEAKPISGVNNDLVISNALTLAKNRGNNWHILNIKALSAMQILQLIEFATTDSQSALNSGICMLQSGNSSSTRAATTGSTQMLGNTTGVAQATTFTYDGAVYTLIDSGKCACSYRGYLNPWSNMWQFIEGLILQSSNHLLYICNNFSYSNVPTDNYSKIAFKINQNNGWASNFGYDSTYDWLYMPIATSQDANSLGPISDYFYAPASSANYTTVCMYGGSWSGSTANGMFCYAFDRNKTTGKSKNINARLLYIPNKDDQNYTTNVNKWTAFMGA